LSLAALECFVNLDTDLSPRNLVAVAADVPESLRLERIGLGGLPEGWRRYPAPESLQDIGTAWVARGSTAILSVPSAVIPEERNYLLNPVHPEFKRIRLGEPKPFHFDPRMWKAGSRSDS
jgi:RES domain-containing protein